MSADSLNDYRYYAGFWLMNHSWWPGYVVARLIRLHYRATALIGHDRPSPVFVGAKTHWYANSFTLARSNPRADIKQGFVSGASVRCGMRPPVLLNCGATTLLATWLLFWNPVFSGLALAIIFWHYLLQPSFHVCCYPMVYFLVLTKTAMQTQINLKLITSQLINSREKPSWIR